MKEDKKQKGSRRKHQMMEMRTRVKDVEGHYKSDDEEMKETWTDCDKRGCWRWYHYACSGKLNKVEVDVPLLFIIVMHTICLCLHASTEQAVFIIVQHKEHLY